MSLYIKRRKRFLKKIFVGISLFLIGLISFSLLSLALTRAGFSDFVEPSLAAVLVMTVIAIVAFKPLDIAYTKFFKHYLFKKKTYAHMMLMNLAEDLRTLLSLQELGNLIVNTFGDVLHLKTVGLLALSPARGCFDVVAGYGWRLSDIKKVRITNESAITQLMQSNGTHVLIRDRVIRAVPWDEANRLSLDFNNLQASWIIPLWVDKELVGALAFASSSPESLFDEADFQFFREFAEVVSKSVKNAIHVEELMKANKELNDRNSDIIQRTKLMAIEQLASGIAHEIHNPLTIISGKAQMLLLRKEKGFLDEKTGEVLKNIIQQTQRAAEITRKLLMFSQDSGAAKEWLNLEQVLRDTVALISYQTSLEGIEVTQVVRGVLPAFYGNVHEIREVFLNLILNAVESLHDKRGTVRCELIFRASEQLIEILVLDTGKGMESKDLEQIFNPFFTSRHGKTGLGLFVSRQIIHRYGGSIKVESRVGEGSLFILKLPVQAGNPSAGSPSGVDYAISSEDKRSDYEEAFSGG